MKKELEIDLKQALKNEEDLKIDEPLANWTTWRVGGCADYLVFPRSIDEIVNVINIALSYDLPVVTLGNGSNVLVLDKGIKGLVINTKRLCLVEVKDTKLYAQAGISMTQLATLAAKHSLTGLEFSAGIPASLGGAILMNAGAWGRSLGELIDEVAVVDYNGNSSLVTKKQLQFKYRKSSLQSKKQIIAAATIRLKRGDVQKIKELMRLHQKERFARQPLGLPNAGSVFKNPKGYAAGFLIEAVGLKGLTIGDAKISDKHANFIVNLGKATAQDILQLIKYAKSKVRDNYGIHLELEVNILGE